ncbi:UNVERIFIED_CONTAM: hypothetical protein Scaly_0066100 [Sesamum calycinum]|uniref:SWIM-type domain-containing protein n=1 Tax=Sesamum calycinum TaxID=2727403 RepID=A0AAW2SV80_9LAMI
MKELDEGAFAWFNDKNPKEWSRSHFSCYPRCDILLNNACESFNSNILEARDKPILSMLEWIMEYLMQRLQQNRDRAKKRWKKVLCPKIQTIIDRNIEKLGDCIPIKSDDKHYQISCFDGTQYSVDLENATCGCRKWDLSGHNARTCQGPVIDVVTDAASQVMGRNELVAEAPNEAVAESETIPQKLKKKGKEPVHKGVDVVMHRRTRSGYIPPTSAFKLPPKATATAPTMFEQFKQCQKGVKIREPASFIDGERQNQEVSNSGSTPSIVKGEKRFVTLSNLSEAVNEGKQKKDKGKKKM